MRHLQEGRKLHRVKRQRRALLKTLMGSLIIKEKIKTTEAKAKEVKRIIDGFITKAKKTKDEAKKVAIIRILKRDLPMMAVEKICSEDFLTRVAKRNSGFTRITKVAPRKSDNASLAIIEFVD